MMFSLLSQGYGTYDGRAKKDAAQEIYDQKDYFSLEDLRLPPIGSNFQPSAQRDVSDYQTGPRYENKAFKLPKVEDKKQSAINVPKTYSTRKGALLLYTEDCFLPGSPKPRKRRRRVRKPPSVKLKTIGDLRNYILDYKNGGDPLFLALLQKQLSGHQTVRPGFSPKRYIATLGNSLEQDTWQRLTAAGSLKDPALLTYDPEGASVHRDGPVRSLFPDKPQPYSTMSLPPLSPSSSMFESSFHFYKNGMSTGAASMISLNSETEEYAPSSRALSPAESLSNRLSEVEFLPQKKDPYQQLNAKQKEDLLSQLLLQKTLESMNSDLSDLQGWVTHYPDNGGSVEQDPAASLVTLPKAKGKHRGSLKSGSLTSIPRLPPIQSAGARPSTPVELKEESTLPSSSTETMAQTHQQRDIQSGKEETDDALDPGSIHLDLGSLDESYSVLDDQREEQGYKDGVINSENTAASVSSDDHAEQEEDQTKGSSQSAAITENNAGMEQLQGDQSDEAADNKVSMSPGSDELTEEQGIAADDAVVGLDDITLTEDTIQENEQRDSHDEEMKDVTTKIPDTDDGQQAVLASSELQEPIKETTERTEADFEDEGIGLDGNEFDDINKTEDLEEEVPSAADEKTAAITEPGEEGDHTAGQEELSSQQVEPPPAISLEDLQGEARNVANKVLRRPQSGMVFMEDVRTAIAMWADRLTSLLGPPNQDARVSSASHQRTPLTGLAAQPGTSRLTRHRKISRSAGPSPAALRNALKISGGEIPGIEALRNLPPLPERFSKAHPTSGDASVHHEKLKHGSASTKGSVQSAARSIPWERISNADVQVDVFSYATKDKEPSFQKVQADEESDEEDEEFKTALNAIVTDVKQDYTFIEAKSRMAISSPKKEQKPFQFPRPVPSKPPAGLQNKQPPQKQVKAKPKAAPPKKPVVAKKKAGKKPAKQTKPSNKSTKTSKVKPEIQTKDEKQQKPEEEVKETVIAEEVKPAEPVRVDSETGEHEPSLSDRTVVSSALSRVTSSRVSSKASDETVNITKSDVPTESSPASVVEMPVLVPKPPEPAQPVQHEPEPEQEPVTVEQKPVQESRAAKRAAERAAAAERRRQEVERKRREREEAKKKAIEEEARLEQLRLEAEEEMRKREDERRQRREEKEAAKRREHDEELERERQANFKAERERRAKEDWKKRQQQVLAQRKLEEEMRKEQERIEAELETARLREEEERIKAMEESERIAFLEKMRREEEELRRRLEEQKRKEDEERKVREEERRQREEALALLRQKQLQRHLFVAGILKESHYLSLCQRLTKAFTFSYFDLLPWNHLQHLQAPSSPVRDLLRTVKENIPPTILEEDEDVEE